MSSDQPTSQPENGTAPDPALSFGSVVDAYERGRPGYPLDAVRWLTGDQPLTVLELGAGTGKLTRALVELGHDVHATEPDPAMLDKLAKTVSVSRLTQASAEDLPVEDGSYDLVIAGQAYHWFDPERALPEIARVLKRGGHLALIWNLRDERIPWVKRLGNLIGHQDATGTLDTDDEDDALASSPYFGPIEEATFKHWQTVDRGNIRDLALSRSTIATLPADEREARIDEVVAFYDDFGRGMDGMQLPYVTECYRAVVGIRPKPKAAAPAPEPAAETDGPERDTAIRGAGAAPEADSDFYDQLFADSDSPRATDRPSITEPPTDDDSGMLLIDFR